MLTVAEIRRLLAIVVPVYFDPAVPENTIREILERTFLEQEIFCRPECVVAVVDRETRAEKVLQNPAKDSSLRGLRVHSLERHRAKAGAIQAGLQLLLESTDAEFLITRDCDGDNVLEDLPSFVRMAHHMQKQTGSESVSVLGRRLSLEKPMGWVRQQWEVLSNRVLEDLVEFSLARTERVLDRRFWGGAEPDIQSGYRLYTRQAARQALESFSGLPDDPLVLVLACEILPFVQVCLEGGVMGQVQRTTLVEQPISSYTGVDFPVAYGRLLAYVAANLGIPRPVLLQIFDNHLVGAPLFFSGHRQDALRCRQCLEPQALPLCLPSFL